MESPRAMLKRSDTYFKKGEFESASKLLAKAASLLNKDQGSLDDKRLLSEIMRMKAFSDCRRGDFITAAATARAAMDISLSIGDDFGEADALRRLGYIHWQKADHAMALEFYDAAIQKANACKAEGLIGKITVEIGNTLNHMRENSKAERAYIEAARIFKKVGDLGELTRTTNNLGALYLNMERYKEAVTVLKRTVKMADKLKDPTLKAWSRFNTAEGLIMYGKVREALDFLDQAYRIMRKGDDLSGLAAVHMFYGQAYTRLKEWTKAKRHMQQALEIERRMGFPKNEGEAYIEMGRMYLAKGDKDKARAYITLGLKVYEKADLKNLVTEVNEMLKKI